MAKKRLECGESCRFRKSRGIKNSHDSCECLGHAVLGSYGGRCACAEAGDRLSRLLRLRFICFLCRRKFQSAALLTKHKQLSELHRRNLSKQEEENQQRKEELRQAVAATRRQVQEPLTRLAGAPNALQEVEISLSKLEAPDEASKRASDGSGARGWCCNGRVWR